MKNGLHNQLGKGLLFTALLAWGGANPYFSYGGETSPATTVSDLVQTKTITGKVVDQKGQPIIGATVIVQNTSRGDITTADGSFRVEGVKVGDNLEVAFIGYVTKFVPVGTETNIDITLEEDALKVEDVVVVGFGTQKKVNLTGAVSAVDSEELLKRPVANIQQMLQGAVPGLNVDMSTSQPGNETISMNIRGNNSFGTTTAPLVLVDGVEGNISDVDPNSVESISVLKDAASASIYGSRAANGVLLITTKKGTGTREKISISYNMNLGFHKADKLWDLVSDPVEYMQLKNIAITNYPEGDRVKGGLYTEAQMDLYRNETDKNGKYSGFDWQKYMFRTALVQNHNVGIAGTVNTTSYNINLSYMNQEGTMRGYGYKRYNMTMAVQSQVKPWLKIGANTAFMHGYRNNPRNGSMDGFLSTIASAPTYKPWVVDDNGNIMYDSNGNIMYTSYAFPNEKTDSGSRKHALMGVNQYSWTRNQTYNANLQAFFEANLVKGLKWYTKAAVRFGQSNTRNWSQVGVPAYNYLTGEQQGTIPVSGKGLDASTSTSVYTNIYTYLNYDWSSKNEAHNFSIMAGYSQEQSDYRSMGASRQNYKFPLYEINAGDADATRNNSGSSTSWALMSAFGRANYNYKERYLLEANIRYDGTSRIASENRWGVFPSFSAGWRLTEEKFMKDLNLSWLNNVKFRGSWGLLGNQDIGTYPYQALLSMGMAYNYAYDNKNITTGAAYSSAVNRDLKWETTAIGDFGLDLQLFRGLNITFDWYKKRTYNILRTLQVNALLGLNGPTINDGEMTNQGIEFLIGWNDRIKDGFFKDFGYRANFFITRNRNKLTKYGTTDYGYIGEFGNPYLIYEQGQPYGQYYMYEAIGIYESDAQVAQREWNGYKIAPIDNKVQAGDMIYHDVNGDGKISDEDRVKFDGYYEKFSYTINLGFDWKGFDFSMMLQGRAGKRNFTRGYMGFIVSPFVQGTAPTREMVDNCWTPERTVGAKHPRLYYFAGENIYRNNVNSSYFLKRSGYLRIKNLTVGYTIPRNITEKIGVQKFRVYFSGDNLATATPYDGLDPESSMGYGSRFGMDYPLSRICSFGINLQF